jgi:pyruvate-formate lyase
MQCLQLNCTSKKELLDAQKHPEKYPDLIVRVTGFSARFTALSPEWQQEVLTRNFYE